MSATMRSVRQQAFGGPEVLQLTEAERPVPMATEVLVRVRAVGLNPVEAMIRSGQFPLLGEPPFILGWDISGVVEDMEPGVTRFQPGDEVYGMPFFPRQAAAYADYVVAPSRQLARKPANLSHVEAAALPLVGLTAWQGLVDVGGLDETGGQLVVVHGGGGGVGHVAVQIAKAYGAEVVATASAGKADFVRSLGADLVVDYRTTDFTSVVRNADIVYDTVGGYAERSMEVLKPGGVLVSATERRNLALAARVEAAGLKWGALSVEPDYAALEMLTVLVESGRLRPHVEHVLPLEQVASAHKLVESRHTQGKIVLSMV
jgi:NADPH:quinone reductase-like Zn-dependent oxidoreductase